MEKKRITQEMIDKFLKNQKLIKKYLQGDVTKKQLDEAGIKLAKPI